jgi:hypothetical protein
MKALRINPINLSKERVLELKSRGAKLADAPIYIDEEVFLHKNGKPIAIYKKVDIDLLPLLFSCLCLNFPTYERTGGLVTQTINLNYSPRNAKRTNMCQPTDLLVKRPAIHDLFTQYAQAMDSYYKQYFKKEYSNQLEASINKIDPTYLIENTVFTGGVVNKDSSLSYHRDNANTKDGISCMIILKKYARGGELVLPELGVSFACQDGYMLLFDGQKYLHGVTPIKVSKKGYRYTTVFYNNKGMSLCLSPKEELEYFEQYNLQQIRKKEINGK